MRKLYLDKTYLFHECGDYSFISRWYIKDKENFKCDTCDIIVPGILMLTYTPNKTYSFGNKICVGNGSDWYYSEIIKCPYIEL